MTDPAAPGTTALHTTAPAKVNLGLRVMSRRPDGFHMLRSVFLRLALADEVTLAGATGPDDTLVIEGDPACPVEDNLALAAATAFRDAAGSARVGPVAVRLRKRIPMAAGLAGGSSDAAAVLRSLAHRFPGAVSDGRLSEVAHGIGSDVPFFLAAVGAAVVSGAGDDVEPLPPPIEPLGCVLVKPAVGLSTGHVFGAWDALSQDAVVTPGDPATIDQLAAELRAGASPATLVDLAPRLRDANDLWPAACLVEPRMDAFRAALEARLDRPVLMTGSGSTLLAVFATEQQAARAAVSLADDPPHGLEDAWIEASASGTPYPPEVVSLEERA